MSRFLKNTKGAVTVFVTLLLIPAMLISGTAVDLVRLHTARSIIQDANQLAANSVLTQYNALLNDIYGLMGVAENDPILWSLLDEYIKVSVFGEAGQDTSLGTLQVFYGANISMDELYFPDDKNLRNEEVLRRQIEEYMKFRGPVVLVAELIESLTGNKLKADAEVIQDKLKIDSSVAEIFDKYKELYDAIIAADKCILPIGGISGSHFGTISSKLESIRNQFIDLKICYAEWDSLDPEDDDYDSAKADIESHYKAILFNIRSYMLGGYKGSDWSNGFWKKNDPINTSLDHHVEGAIKLATDFKTKFDAVVDIAGEVDAMRGELNRNIDALEAKINNNECSPEVKAIFTTKSGNPEKTLIERYRALLKWDVQPMAVRYKDGGYSYIDDTHIPMVRSVKYRNVNNASSLSLTCEELINLSTNSAIALSTSVPYSRSMAAVLGSYVKDDVTYKMLPGFKKFSEHSNDNRAFFSELEQMMKQHPGDPVKLFEGQKDGEGSDTTKKQQNIIDDLLRFVNEAYDGLTNNPIGARYVTDSEAPEIEKLNILDMVKLMPQALSSPVLGIIQDPLGSAAAMGDYILLLTYSTSMFSNYTTAKPESVGKTRSNYDGVSFPKSISGATISPEVNYFFQSEWEYLYNGSDNAAKNLSAVTRLIFLVRFVCNYIVVFNVSEITSIVTAIQGAFSWAPPLGLVLGELARAAFVAAESLIDVAALRTGHKAPIFKNVSNGEWVCSPSGLLNALGNIMSGGSVDGGKYKNEKGLTYSHYMLFFFIAKAVVYIGSYPDAAAELAVRTGDLIEYNIINYKNGCLCDEEKMKEALAAGNRFRLADMKTDFSITTTADVRMLFLSMVFAQNFSDSRGIGMPSTMPVTATDYRGY